MRIGDSVSCWHKAHPRIGLPEGFPIPLGNPSSQGGMIFDPDRRHPYKTGRYAARMDAWIQSRRTVIWSWIWRIWKGQDLVCFKL
nr:ADM_HP1_G0005920.mRNA.1.CDS.1 [Saccharomyces cerevisiae]